MVKYTKIDHIQNLGNRNSNAVKGQEKIDAVKGQILFLVKVKSQGTLFILTMVATRSTESMVVPPP